MTPFQIEILLHHYTKIAPFPRISAGYYNEVATFIDKGLLRTASTRARSPFILPLKEKSL